MTGREKRCRRAQPPSGRGRSAPIPSIDPLPASRISSPASRTTSPPIAAPPDATHAQTADRESPTPTPPAFTLIELLVVITLVAGLMAVLLPALSRARQQARSAACQSNLHQCALDFWTVAAETERGLGDSQGASYWYLFHSRPDPVLCPLAKQVLWDDWRQAKDQSGAAQGRGATHSAWGFRWDPDANQPGPRGSYGLNDWMFRRLESDFARSWWRPSEAEGRANVPVLLDSRFTSSRPHADDAPPPEADARAGILEMADFCIDRHQGGLNALMADSSARKVGLKELWTLKWHRNFDTAGKWTRSGGVRPEDWPPWMRRFDEY